MIHAAIMWRGDRVSSCSCKKSLRFFSFIFHREEEGISGSVLDKTEKEKKRKKKGAAGAGRKHCELGRRTTSCQDLPISLASTLSHLIFTVACTCRPASVCVARSGARGSVSLAVSCFNGSPTSLQSVTLFSPRYIDVATPLHHDCYPRAGLP